MSNLNEVKWKVFKFSDIFIIKNGYYSKKPPIEGGNIPFLSATRYNNGVSAFYSQETINTYDKSGEISDKNIKNRIFKGNCLSINNNGSVGYVFYQKTDFTCSSDVTVVYLKNHTLNEYIAKFLIKVAMNAGKNFDYARKWKAKRMCNTRIMLPVDDQDRPNWLLMEQFIKNLELAKIQNILSIYKNKLSAITINENVIANQPEYKKFFIGGKEGVFNIKATKSGIDKNKLNDRPGKTPYITRSEENNGINLFVSDIQNSKYKLDEGNVITIGLDTQTIFYQKHEFFTGQNIQVLRCKHLNYYNAMFIIPLLKNQLKKFSWGSYGATLGRLNRTSMMLPVDDQGTPHWSYMENFIKVKERNQIQKIIKHFEIRLAQLTN